MKKLSLLMLLSVFVFCGCSNDEDEKTFILNLPDYEAETLYLGDTEHPAESWDSYGIPYVLTLLTDNNRIFEFDCVSSTYGFGSDAFAFTNATSGNYSAITKKGVNKNSYVVVGSAGYKVGAQSDKEAAIRFKNSTQPNKLEDYHVKGIYITNSLYAYTSMNEGTSYFHDKGQEDKFDANDSFKLTIYNHDKTAQVDCYLGQGRDILKEWKWIDLSALGETKGLKFKLSSTKNDEFGMMTPAYFCIDGITLAEK